jgi:hypothetical protein
MLSGRLVKISALILGLGSAAVTELRPSAAEDTSRAAGDRIMLHQCEKELGRHALEEFLRSGVVEGGTILAGSYKGYKLSNTLKQKDVASFLREHGVRDPITIRKVAPRIKFAVTGKIFRGVAVVGMVFGGVMVVH